MLGLNMKDSSALIFCIFIWISYFAAIGHFLFSDSMQGMMVFDTFGDSFW